MSAQSIRSVCHIIANDKPRFVVVSAVKGITDLLESFCSAPISLRKTLLQEIIHIHLDILYGFQLPFFLKPWIQKLTRYVYYDGFSPKEKADILATGEDISSALVLLFCQEHGIPVQFLEARKVILTDDVYDVATPDIEAMRLNWNLLSQPSSQHTCIMQGFIGTNSKGETTLLGRGGSDYSAALLAELIHADRICLYKDVDGIYTKDPHLEEGAKLISDMNFDEMEKLASLGARVLYRPTLISCRRSKTPIFVSCTFNTRIGGTLIHA